MFCGRQATGGKGDGSEMSRQRITLLKDTTDGEVRGVGVDVVGIVSTGNCQRGCSRHCGLDADEGLLVLISPAEGSVLFEERCKRFDKDSVLR